MEGLRNTYVAPSRARGLKHAKLVENTKKPVGRALTGAWIETEYKACPYMNPSTRRALTGAWIETIVTVEQSFCSSGRALTGAWIETTLLEFAEAALPSRPHGRVD